MDFYGDLGIFNESYLILTDFDGFLWISDEFQRILRDFSQLIVDFQGPFRIINKRNEFI